jgi:hypothetical protein
MPLPASGVWEVESTGSDSNGGMFDPLIGTTDYTYGATQQTINYTDLASTNGNSSSPQITSATRSFVAADVGNSIQITSGSSWTTGIFNIRSVSGGAATLDRPCGSTATLSSGVGNLGGPLASPGFAAGQMVGGNYLNVKQATYSITSMSPNLSNGCLSLPAGTTTNATKVIGYQATRGDNGTKPLLQASGISSFTLIAAAANCHIANLSLDGASSTSSAGIVPSSTNVRVFDCQIANCTNRALNLGSSVTNLAILCEITGCGTNTATAGGGYLACVAHGNTVTPFDVNNSGSMCVKCIAFSNSGATTDGFTSSTASVFLNCLAYGNGRHGFNLTAGAVLMTLLNCLATDHTVSGSYGFTASGVADGVSLFNCAGYNNQAGNVNSASILNNLGFIACSSSPFNNPGTDFGLNSLGMGGALLLGAGLPLHSGPLSLPGLPSTLNFRDIGAVQTRAGSPGILCC